MHSKLVFFQKIRLIFIAFDTHNHNDVLKIWHSSGSQLSMLWGDQPNRPDIVAPGSFLFMTFVSDGSNRHPGFYLEYLTDTSLGKTNLSSKGMENDLLELP